MCVILSLCFVFILLVVWLSGPSEDVDFMMLGYGQNEFVSQQFIIAVLVIRGRSRNIYLV